MKGMPNAHLYPFLKGMLSIHLNPFLKLQMPNKALWLMATLNKQAINIDLII
jgi:hypothetical protein